MRMDLHHNSLPRWRKTSHQISPANPSIARSLFSKMIKVLIKMVKSFLVFFAILASVTVVASIIACLFLSNGNVEYLIDLDKLFEFVFYTRSGLKVNILFVTMMLFFLAINNDILNREWFQR